MGFQKYCFLNNSFTMLSVKTPGVGWCLGWKCNFKYLLYESLYKVIYHFLWGLAVSLGWSLPLWSWFLFSPGVGDAVLWKGMLVYVSQTLHLDHLKFLCWILVTSTLHFGPKLWRFFLKLTSWMVCSGRGCWNMLLTLFILP